MTVAVEERAPDRATAEQRARAITEPFRSAYPFEPRFVEVDGGWMHYVDEGPRDGEPVLALHGNPTWSFLYRTLVRGLGERWRVVAPDHLGCGLSDKPQSWPYTLSAHVDNLERLVLELDLRRLTLVLHDWGGAIGMGLAARVPERIARLVVLNTAAFPSDRMPLRIRVCRTPLLGRFCVQAFNAFARAATHMAVARPLSAEARRGLLAPYDAWARRLATWKFVDDIPMSPRHRSWPALVAIADALPRFRALPTCIVWGERDFCFTPAFRRMWQERFPEAEVHALPDAGHYLLEDAPDEVVGHVRAFLESHPLPRP